MKKIESKVVEEHWYIVIWIIFLAYLLYQHSLVWIHFDDFGYLSLNYAVDIGIMGDDYTAVDIFRYLWMHYTRWGGRVLYYAFFIFAYHYFGLAGVRILQVVYIFGIYYITFKIVNRGILKNKVIASILVCALFGIFQNVILTEGIYWFAASSTYVWPICVILFASYQYIKLIEMDEKRIRKWYLNGAIWFVGGFSNEEAAIASVVISVLLSLYGVIVHKIKLKRIWISTAGAIIGALIMLSAPGNWVRMSGAGNLEFWDQIFHNVSCLFWYLFGENTRIFYIVCNVTFTIAALQLLSMKGDKIGVPIIKWSLMGYSLIEVVIISVLIVFNKSISDIISATSLTTIATIFIIVLYLVGVVLTAIYLTQNQRTLELCYTCGAIVSYGAMILVPAIPFRILLPVMLLLLPTVSFIWLSVDRSFKNDLFYIPCLLLLIGNMYNVCRGYQINNPLQKQNWASMVEASNQVKSGESVSQITLKKMYSDQYTGPMTYESDYQWAETLMCKFYNILEPVEILWEDSYDVSLWIRSDENGVMLFDEHDTCIASVTPNIYLGDEIICVNGCPVESVKGDTFASFSFTREDAAQGRIVIQVVSPTLGCKYIESIETLCNEEISEEMK